MKKNCEVIFIQEQKMIRNFKTFTIRKKIEKNKCTDFEVLYKKLLIFKSQIFKEQGKEQNQFKNKLKVYRLGRLGK